MLYLRCLDKGRETQAGQLSASLDAHSVNPPAHICFRHAILLSGRRPALPSPQPTTVVVPVGRRARVSATPGSLPCCSARLLSAQSFTQLVNCDRQDRGWRQEGRRLGGAKPCERRLLLACWVQHRGLHDVADRVSQDAGWLE